MLRISLQHIKGLWDFCPAVLPTCVDISRGIIYEFIVLSRGGIEGSGHSNGFLMLALWVCDGWKPQWAFFQLPLSALPLGLVLPINYWLTQTAPKQWGLRSNLGRGNGFKCDHGKKISPFFKAAEKHWVGLYGGGIGVMDGPIYHRMINTQCFIPPECTYANI